MFIVTFPVIIVVAVHVATSWVNKDDYFGEGGPGIRMSRTVYIEAWTGLSLDMMCRRRPCYCRGSSYLRLPVSLRARVLSALVVGPYSHQHGLQRHIIYMGRHDVT